MTYSEYLKEDYSELIKAANTITGGSHYAIELLHYSIVELAGKKTLQEVLDAGAARFYLVRIMMTQHRSVTGPFYRNCVKQSLPILYDVTDFSEENEELDVKRVNLLLDALPWYDRELFKLYAAGEHNYSTLSELTKIPRTSISLTIRRVRDYLKKNL